MKTYDQLENEFKDKVARLQKKCRHEKTEWLESFWAPGHSSGRNRVCSTCGKVLVSEPPLNLYDSSTMTSTPTGWVYY